MLHAPPAKLLAEREGWKLTAALNAICHLDADYHVITQLGVKLYDSRASGEHPRIRCSHIKYKEYERCEFIFI